MKKGMLYIMAIFMGLILISGCEKKDTAKKDESMMEVLSGKWTGTIMVHNQPLDIIVSLNKNDGWSGNISIPVQGVNDYPLSSVTVNNKNISFFMKIQGQQISFDGNVDNNKIEGNFSQHGQTFSFELTKSDEGDQTADNTGEFLSVQTDNGRLYGELEEPSGEGPFPVMIIIPGSGPTDRNGNSPAIQGKNNSLKLLAEQLSEHGIASVRYDKRGVGKNVEAAIPENELDFNQFVHDAKTWVEQLAQEEAYTKVGIIGHSQGSLVGMVAARDSNADAFISIAGAGHPIDQVLYDQLKGQLSGELL
ncbi:alpha/beta hydrolase [Virgibacillus sp. L01]|uniref:alpha/beta hydrolase n=1 Tax=Virgibacillus sp. L01 TaxID=3457429 RepID=UPI003FD47C23